MSYVINVSMTGTHLFRTAEDSITSESTAKEVFKLLKQKFPDPTYEISIALWENRGQILDWK